MSILAEPLICCVLLICIDLEGILRTDTLFKKHYVSPVVRQGA